MNGRSPAAGVAVDNTPIGGAPAAQAGRDAVCALWHEHRRWVAAVLLAYKPAYAELDDLLQDVAMALVKNIAELRDPRSVRAWLRTVAINAARAAARPGRNRLMLRLAGHDVAGGDDEPILEPLACEDQAQRMLRLTAELPCEYAEPLLLRSVHGMSAREVASILEITEVAVHNRVSRARRMLRERAEQSIRLNIDARPASRSAAEQHAESFLACDRESARFQLCDGGAA